MGITKEILERHVLVKDISSLLISQTHLYQQKQILVPQSLHIKSQNQMLPNSVQVVVKQTTPTLNAPLLVWLGENNA